MTKIIPVKYFDTKKIIKMIEYISPGFSPGMADNRLFVPFPLNAAHNLLPLHWKFLQESYIAVENNEPLGLITLTPDGQTKTRWKINRLVLGMNALDIGKQLIDYVVNKYGGAGVEVFLAVIDENYVEAISLFKNACSFRGGSKINVWEPEIARSAGNTPKLLRPATEDDAERLLELDTESILPQFRTSLVKKQEDFSLGLKNKLSNRIKGHTLYKYVLDNPDKDRIEAVLSIITADKINYWADITISIPYQDYYENILNFALNTVKALNKDARLYIGVKDYQQTGKFMAETLKDRGYKQCGNFQVLVKDYWTPTGFYRERKAPAIIFPDMTSPACNIIRFISEC